MNVMEVRVDRNKGDIRRKVCMDSVELKRTNGVQDVVALMDAYYLMKEDFENVMEISSWGGKPSPFSKLDPKVKAAFTRAYNKEAHLTPYSLQAVKAPGTALALPGS
ncbi:Replication factor C subunit 1 [Myotis davidii]|uniref:Replication factor C subunit 1 n=1 Tax=Myotis davidii TaxID=225400 RepID=L5LMT3_MYODS|nr:Replication factor C subunit 1 [Myotis davidii]